jgi:hypothetical protein
VDHSLARFGDPAIADRATGILFELVEDISKIMDCPGLPDSARMAAVVTAVDERAPAPSPADGRFKAPTGPDSPAGPLCDLIRAIRQVCVSEGGPRRQLRAVAELCGRSSLMC